MQPVTVSPQANTNLYVGLILGVILRYMVSASLGCFLWLVSLVHSHTRKQRQATKQEAIELGEEIDSRLLDANTRLQIQVGWELKYDN